MKHARQKNKAVMQEVRRGAKEAKDASHKPTVQPTEILLEMENVPMIALWKHHNN